jgi:hypothetical protein
LGHPGTFWDIAAAARLTFEGVLCLIAVCSLILGSFAVVTRRRAACRMTGALCAIWCTVAHSSSPELQKCSGKRGKKFFENRGLM